MIISMSLLTHASVYDSVNNKGTNNNSHLNEEKRSVVLKKNVSLAEQIQSPNIIYIIKYDLYLDKDITIPANCVLKFEGGSIIDSGTYRLNGQNTDIEAGLERIFNTNIILTGTWNVDKFDIRWFGVKPDDKTIDCTSIINNIKSCCIPIYFPKGTYYLSELYYHNKKDERFCIIGEDPDGLPAIVNFMPYNASQRYIIKIGGGASTLGGDGRGYNITILHINFTTPFGYKPSKLSNKYNKKETDYLNGGLILDVIEVGHFAISGCEIHNMPFLNLGYIYECEFDYIICYGNHGKSTQPAIQIINNQDKPYSALHVKKMMGEVLVGPMIKTVGRCSGSEFVIDSFFFEGTVNWERESIKSETRYSEIIRLSDYEVVPIFYMEGCGFTIVDAEINSINTKWNNRLDNSRKQCVRGLLSFNNTFESVNILRLNNNGGARWMYITGTALESYPINVYIGKTNCSFQTDTRYINLLVDDKQIIDEGKTIPLMSNELYSDGRLNEITIPYFIKNIGTSSYIQQLKNEKKEVIVLPNSYLFNEYGFDLDSNMTCFFLEYRIGKSSNSSIIIEYYNSSDVLLASENVKVISDKSVRQRVVTINPPKSTSFFKLKYGGNNSISMSVYKFGIFDSNNVPGKRFGKTRPDAYLITPGFCFFDSTINKPIYWTGNPAQGDNGWVDANGSNPSK